MLVEKAVEEATGEEAVTGVVGTGKFYLSEEAGSIESASFLFCPLEKMLIEYIEDASTKKRWPYGVNAFAIQ
jgi:hypothetical protein